MRVPAKVALPNPRRLLDGKSAEHHRRLARLEQELAVAKARSKTETSRSASQISRRLPPVRRTRARHPPPTKSCGRRASEKSRVRRASARRQPSQLRTTRSILLHASCCPPPRNTRR